MGWAEYYKSRCVSFGAQTRGYQEAINKIKKANPSFLELSTPHTFVLGGFFPTNGTPEEFLRFSRSIHPNFADKHILMDMNSQPVRSAPNMDRIQALLENPPFRRASVDVLFLDFTLYLMNDLQVESLGYQASRFLKPDGAILAAVPANPPLSLDGDLFDDRTTVTKVPYYFRTPSDIMHLCYRPASKIQKLTPQALVRDGSNYIFGFTNQK